MQDIYVVLLLMLGTFGGVVLASAVMMFVVTRKRVVKWMTERALELSSDITGELFPESES